MGMRAPNGSTIVMSNEERVDLDRVDRIKMVTFYVSNRVAIGLKSLYLNDNNSIQEGKEMLSSSIMDYTEESIVLDEIVMIKYSLNVSNVYLCFVYANGTQKEIGKGNEKEEMEILSLDKSVVKDIEVLIDRFEEN